MMLRASSELNSASVNLGTVTSGDEVESGVPGQAGLIALVESTLGTESADDLPSARRLIEHQLGPAALVDAAAVIGNFQRMTRIADGTGIPLDAPVAAMTADIREELGINEFGSAAYTPRVGWWKRKVFRVLQPLMIGRLRRQLDAR
jgi:hypothetical protein